MDKKREKMTETMSIFSSKENIDRVHVQTGMGKRNIELTYIKNGYGKDKSKMLRVLSLGSMCAEKDITVEELDIALRYAIEMREVNGTS